ncbi:MAG: acyl-protein synthetase [Candidatus Aenigmarchaeota archaeon]|nr:acyl-protein synthetase [Candidatus Aenigmarchaeota archaeon]
MGEIENLLGAEPFGMGKDEKREKFLSAMRESLAFHCGNCREFRDFCGRRGFDPAGKFSLEDIPFLHVDTFKTVRLVSVPEKDIVKSVQSSSTTGNVPSTVRLDRVTIERQRRVLSSIMASFIGPERKAFIILDSPETVKSKEGKISSRASGIRGMLPFSKQVFYALNENLEPDAESLRRAVGAIGPGVEVCFFGFTFLMYKFVVEAEKNKEMLDMLKGLHEPVIVHTGGWKKLKDLMISKAEFNESVAKAFNTVPGKVIDMYGMTEQLGTVYPDCERGYKHVPVYSDIIIRDPNTFEPVRNGEPGLIQLLSPVPNSYPGISLITDDMGVMIGDDGCKCGRRGEHFIFKERVKKSEIKGCGDTLK